MSPTRETFAMDKENQVNNLSGRAIKGGSQSSTKKARRQSIASTYVGRVKEVYGASSQEYLAFSKTLRDFKAKTVATEDVVKRIMLLFDGKEQLILGFNAFLPVDGKIELPPPKTSPSFPSSVQQSHKPNNCFDHDEDPPLETELEAIDRLEQELEELRAKERPFVQLKEIGVVFSAKSQEEFDSIKWEIVVVQETIANIRLGIKLRSNADTGTGTQKLP